VAAASRLARFFLCYLSRPAADRPLYRAIARHRSLSIVEIGIGSVRRSERLIRAAQANDPAAKVSYTAVDLFELRAAQEPRLSLKDAYCRLKATGARVRLLPGDPWSALSRHANTLTGTDLLVVAAGQEADSLKRAWFYVPRMLHGPSQVYLERRDDPSQPAALHLLPAAEIHQLAAAPARRAA
jgi:hypothetical protein